MIFVPQKPPILSRIHTCNARKSKCCYVGLSVQLVFGRRPDMMLDSIGRKPEICFVSLIIKMVVDDVSKHFPTKIKAKVNFILA